MNKIPTMFERDWNGDRSRVLNQVHSGCEWVAAGEGIATRKIDGTCVMVRDGRLYKRRELRDADSQKDLIRYASQNVILQLIPVLDNFHMSTDHIPEDQRDGGWVVGIMHIQKQLEGVLAENGIEEIPAKVGDTFDPVMHEAIEDKECLHCKDKKEFKNMIKKVVLKGYKMGEKVIRPARVRV